MRLAIPLNDLLHNIVYVADDGSEVHLKPQRYDAVTDAELLNTWRGYFQFHQNHCLHYLIRITKDEYNTMQRSLRHPTVTGSLSTHFANHRLPMVWPSHSSAPDGPSELVIASVKNRTIQSGKVCVSINIENVTHSVFR